MKKKGKVKGEKDEEVNGQGGRGVPWPHTGTCHDGCYQSHRELHITNR